MRRTISIIFLLLISTFSFTFSQVVIKEKVNLKPKTNFPTISAQEHEFTYILTWTPDEARRGNIQIVTCSNEILNSGLTTSGSTSITFVAKGRHHFEFHEEQWGFNGVDTGWFSSPLPNGHIQVLVDGTELSVNQNVIGGYNGVSGKFDFTINGSLCPYNNTSLSMKNIQWGDCNDGLNWYITDPLTLKIIEGSTYAYLYNISTGTNLGSSVQLDNYQSLQYIVLRGDENAPPVYSKQIVKLEANINGVLDTAETGFQPNTFLIDAIPEPDTIFAGSSAYLNISVSSACRTFPSETKINIEIKEGNKYGNLIEPSTGEGVQSYSGYGRYGYMDLYYSADNLSIDTTVSVLIEVSTSDSTIPYADIKLVIEPSPISITIKPNEIMPKDTAQIIIKMRNPDGSLGEFPYWQTYEVSMLDGCEGGELLVDTTRGEYFFDVPQPIKFIAADSLTSDSIEVNLRVGLVDRIISFNMVSPQNNETLIKSENFSRTYKLPKLKYQPEKKVKNSKDSSNKTAVITSGPKENQTESTYCYSGDYKTKLYNEAKLVEKNNYEILLGQTKYYGVKIKNDTMKIVEIKTDYGKVPSFPSAGTGWNWIKDNSVWGNNPVSVDTGKNYGKKMGVYWETDKPVWDGNTNKGNLAKGLIRLVGRYWTADSTYKVSLNANKDKKSVSIKIKIVKPKKLLTSEQTNNYIYAKDVHDSTYSIDSICFYYGGKYGIPPQMLKGQMFTESAKKNFGDTVGWGFAPSYRYEPYTTQFDKVVKNIVKADKNPFIVTDNAMGKPTAANVPTETEHKNVLRYHYFNKHQTVWELVKENSSLEDVDHTNHTYGLQYKGTDKDTLKKYQLTSQGLYSAIDVTYADYLLGPKDKKTKKRSGGYEDSIRVKYKLKLKEKLSKSQQIEANDSAYIATINFLKNKFNGGLVNSRAQTRIASSYGLLQILYTTAEHDHDYPVTDTSRPENLNEVKIGMHYALENLKKLFKYNNKFSLTADNNWISKYHGQLSSRHPILPKPIPGFEQALSVMFYKWNTCLHDSNNNAIYHKLVLDYSKQFLPRSK